MSSPRAFALRGMAAAIRPRSYARRVRHFRWSHVRRMSHDRIRHWSRAASRDAGYGESAGRHVVGGGIGRRRVNFMGRMRTLGLALATVTLMVGPAMAARAQEPTGQPASAANLFALPAQADLATDATRTVVDTPDAPLDEIDLQPVIDLGGGHRRCAAAGGLGRGRPRDDAAGRGRCLWAGP